jgi:Protein of unknown function (DUF1488)
MLNFPNPSRSFDASRSRVRFWGYEGAVEISFFVDEGALRRLCPEMSSVEAGFLSAFDAARKRIHKVAAKVYARAGKGVSAFSLAADDF